MHYLLLALGGIFGVIALIRFLKNANSKDIIALVFALGIIAVTLALFVLAVTGRLPAAIALVGAIWPFLLGWWRHRNQAKSGTAQATANEAMTLDEALEVLELQNNPSIQDIREAHRRLMKKNHPDQEGSEWFAKKLNQAKDLLLKHYG